MIQFRTPSGRHTSTHFPQIIQTGASPFGGGMMRLVVFMRRPSEERTPTLGRLSRRTISTPSLCPGVREDIDFPAHRVLLPYIESHASPHSSKDEHKSHSFWRRKPRSKSRRTQQLTTNLTPATKFPHVSAAELYRLSNAVTEKVNEIEQRYEHTRLSNAERKQILKTELEHCAEYNTLWTFYNSAFASFQSLNIAFQLRRKISVHSDKRSTSNFSNLDDELISTAFQQLLKLPAPMQKTVHKNCINSLLATDATNDHRLSVGIDELRAYMILVQNPQFDEPSTYVVFSMLLRQIASLPASSMKTMVGWMSRLPPSTFKSLLDRCTRFIGVRLFPPRPQDLPPMATCAWWIPSAVKVIGILYSANNLARLPIVPYTQFYVDALDHWDVQADYWQWARHGDRQFTFCAHAFVLSVHAKRMILDGYCENIMIDKARQSIMGNLLEFRAPTVNMVFLTITVRRSHVLVDSIAQLAAKRDSMHKKMRVKFADEPGIDMGGVTKEWLQLLTSELFDESRGMFERHSGTEVYWFTRSAPHLHTSLLPYYNLVGTLMGLSIYNSAILEVQFPLVLFTKILSHGNKNTPHKSVVLDGQQNTPTRSAALIELRQIDAVIADNLQTLLDYEEDVEADFGLTFQVTVTDLNKLPISINLKEKGDRIPVTKKNRKEYVDLYVDWFINTSTESRFKALLEGFHSVCPSEILTIFRAEEIELMACGKHEFVVSELRQNTVYDGGYTKQSTTIKLFWNWLESASEEKQRKLLRFVTGSDRVPLDGFKEQRLKITRLPDTPGSKRLLPVAHTCFNQLVLPDYSDRSVLIERMEKTLQYGVEGFGIV